MGFRWTCYRWKTKAGWLLLGLVVWGCALHPSHGQPPTDLQHTRQYTLGPEHTAQLQLEPAPHFSVSGVRQAAQLADSDAGLQSLFKIHVLSDQPDLPAVVGEYRLENSDSVSFWPRYPLSPSVTYQLSPGPALLSQLPATPAAQSLAKPATERSWHFRLPAPPPSEPTRITAVYPSADQLPENLLRFYVHFSAPMSRGLAYQHIRLYRGTTLIDKPFLELGEELWDGQQQRFTLLIHPGRIKHGLRSFDEQGPALVAGENYTLQIDSQWIDASGHRLAETFEKKFTTLPSDSERLNPEHWKIEAPASGSTAPVQLRFDEPLDHAMLGRVLHVTRRDGSAVEGEYLVASGETAWQFTPAARWTTGTYYIQVATILEDVCGNSLAKAFEVDLANVTTSDAAEHLAIEFIVK